jgi:anti-anti-sigma factor
MAEIVPGWEANVERAADWLLVRLISHNQSASDTPPLADWLWARLEEQAVCRLVLELDQMAVLYSYVIGQLVLLHKRIVVHGGTLRLCGLSPHNQQVLHFCRLDDRFSLYPGRAEALRGEPAG